MTAQMCDAPHRDNPPHALGGLRLCAGHLASVQDALTGPSAEQDPTMDAVWGVRDGFGRIRIYDDRYTALTALRPHLVFDAHEHRANWATAGMRLARPWGLVVGYDGIGWTDPGEFKPGGLARDWAALAGLTGHKTASGAYVTGTAEPRLPINPAVADLRDRIPGVLASWARVHVEELGTAPPTGGSPLALCAWLARSIDWAAAQPWAGEYAAELGQLRARARKLIDLPGRPRAVVGPCVERIDGARCQGTLTSAIREEWDARPSLIECDGCGAAYDSTQWMRLGQRVAAMGRRTAA
jgi:hypothetical protein